MRDSSFILAVEETATAVAGSKVVTMENAAETHAAAECGRQVDHCCKSLVLIHTTSALLMLQCCTINAFRFAGVLCDKSFRVDPRCRIFHTIRDAKIP